MFTVRFADSFKATYKALIQGNKEKEKKTKKTLRMLMQDPFYPSLKSHKVNTRNFGTKWSSWITGDLRIIWGFDEKKKAVILLLAVSSHTGAHREYK